jgi:AcrR family transcriptional regulator
MTDEFTKQTSRLLIIDKARKRFAHYGLNKTTMAEIAADCEMSVGNLYRFFKNKEAIAHAGAQACMQEKAERSEAVASLKTDPLQRIHSFLLDRLRFMHGFVGETPHLHEMVEFVMTRSGDMLKHYEDRAIDYIRSALDEGMANGQFRQADSLQLATCIFNSTFRYNMPLCMHAPLNELEHDLDALVQLLFHGFEVKQP